MMFCKSCGSQMPDNAKFCGKCGMAAPQPMRYKPLSGLNMRVAAGGLAAVLVLVIILIVCFGGNGGTEGREGGPDALLALLDNKKEKREDGTAVPAEDRTQTHDMITLDVSSDITLEGRYENLQTIKIASGADGSAVITYAENASFPELESLECSAVIKIFDSGGRGYFDERDFPKLRNVTMKVVNKYIDEDVAMTYVIFQDMYDSGRLQSFRIENSYTVEDLYGAWVNEGQTFALTFEKDGTLRIADTNNLIGVDVMKYRESGSNVLSLSADSSGLLGIISMNMKYELFGDRLWVELMGQTFALTRKQG